MIAMTVNFDTSSTDQLSEKLSAGVIRQAAEGVLRAVKDHYAEMSSNHPNKQGWRRSNFWQKCGQSAHIASITQDEALIVVDKEGAALRLRGGEVVPVTAQWLTIPAVEEAYGRRAREFSGLVFVLMNPQLAALIEKKPGATSVHTGKRIKGSDEGRVFYWLKKETHHEPDESTYPDKETLTDAANEAVEAYLQRA